MTSILPETTTAENKSASHVANFFKEHMLGQMLKKSNFTKQKGFACKDLLQFLVTLVFMGKNLWRYLDSDTGASPFKKDAVYRFLNNFKMSKSYLRLAKEFQGRSYDSMVASTAIVFIRYIMLALESRNGEDPRTIGGLFYSCCDELQDISLAEALQKLLSLLEKFLDEQLQLAEDEIRKLIDYLISNLPPFFKERLAVCCCES